MPVITQYVVERNGKEKMTFMSKVDADNYDRQLEIAEALAALLTTADVTLTESQCERIAMHLAQHQQAVFDAIASKKPAQSVSAKRKTKTPSPKSIKQAYYANDVVLSQRELPDLVIETDEEAMLPIEDIVIYDDTDEAA